MLYFEVISFFLFKQISSAYSVPRGHKESLIILIFLHVYCHFLYLFDIKLADLLDHVLVLLE